MIFQGEADQFGAFVFNPELNVTGNKVWQWQTNQLRDESFAMLWICVLTPFGLVFAALIDCIWLLSVFFVLNELFQQRFRGQSPNSLTSADHKHCCCSQA